MTSFNQILDARSKIPERHVVIERNAFASDWQYKADDVALGLRRIGEGDIQTARAEAAKYAFHMHEDREGQIEAFNDALMRWMVVRGTCDANDITQNAGLFDGSEENVRLALTAPAIRFVWDHIERYHIECSPIVKEVTEGDIKELVTRLDVPSVSFKLPPGARKRFKKLLGFCLEELREVDPWAVQEVDELDELDPENEVEVSNQLDAD